MRNALCALAAPAHAQSQGAVQDTVSAECAGPLTAYRDLIGRLLDASLHGEAAYDQVHNENFHAAAKAALSACRTDGRAKQMIYASQDQLSSYQATRDAALRILQSKPPGPR